MAFKNFWSWCKRHLLLVTFLSVALIFLFGIINIQILHMTSEPEFCAMCHPQKGFGPLAEVDSWEHSGHAEAGVSCLDCHGRPGLPGYMKAKIMGLYDVYMQMTLSPEEKLAILSSPRADLVPAEHCLFCHSDEGNRAYREAHPLSNIRLIEMRMLDSVENPEFRERKGLGDILTGPVTENSRFDHTFHIESFELSCRDCHFGVVHQPQGKTDRMNMCLVCHTENAGSSAPLLADCTGCHGTQNSMYLGMGAIGVAEQESIKAAAGIDCQMCHSAVNRGIFRPSANTCTDCHDPGYSDVRTVWSDDTQGQLDKVRRLRVDVEDALKKADARHRNTSAQWEIYRRAVFNLNLVRKDGSKGVHNADYSMAILESAEADFQRILKDLLSKW